MTETLTGEGFLLRRAVPQDAEFLVDLGTNDEIEPFMGAAAARDTASVLEQIERSAQSPKEHGRFVLEVEWHASSWRAGTIAFAQIHERNRIAELFGVMLHPDFRGRGIATAATTLFARHLIFGLDFHRVQLECYAFNERAIRHFERAGFIREGVKRKAYWRHGEWVDGVMYSLVREDLESE